MLFFVYNAFGYLGFVVCLPLLFLLVLFSEKRRKTFFQRLGLKPLPDPIRRQKRLPGRKKAVWIHALSVGEVLSAVTLVQALRRNLNGRDIFFSVSTQTGYEIASRRLKREVKALFFFPYDLRVTVRHRVRRVDPALVVMVETDVWPNFMMEMKKQRIPVALVNARLSDRSFDSYRRLSGFFGGLFSVFGKICAQSDPDRERFIRLGVRADRVITTGNIKFDQEVDPLSGADLRRLRQDLGIDSSARVLLAGSTHEGEERIVRDVFVRLKRRFPGLKLIVAPRDPKRARRVIQTFTEAGIKPYRASDLNKSVLQKRPDVLVIDTLGMLGRMYAVADIAFVGGSLVPCGGHNPLEAAAYAKPVLFGPDMSDFKTISRMLLQQAGAREIKDAEDFFQAVDSLLSQAAGARRMGRQAHDVFCANRGALARTLREILTLIDAKDGSEKTA